VIAVVVSTVIAAILAATAVMLSMLPLFALGGANGVVDRRPRRGYYRDPYRND